MESGEHFLERIDWDRPWLAPLLAVARPILEAPDWRHALNAAAAHKGLRNHRDLPIRFVLQEELPAGMAYEAHISATGCVPTRTNLHDFFNALVWLSYPHIKVRLNALQAAELAKAAQPTGHSSHRGKVRDAATIFDENAALLIASDASIVEALRHHRWQEVFITRRSEFGCTIEVNLFGHALMEKLTAPYKAVTAHAWIVTVDQAFFRMDAAQRQCMIDQTVQAQLRDGLSTANFSPLPVLGIPGWWENQDRAFYEDATVFRPRRSR